jgi:dethiobiotin synthetase
MLSRIPIPGLFITGTDTNVGKTLVGAGIADWFRRRSKRIGVCKPIATGCEHRREGMISEDAEFLAHHSGSSFPLATICPVRFAEPLAPAVAAERAGTEIDWKEINRVLHEISQASDYLIVEGVGGILVPLDSKHTVLDMASWLGMRVVIVARAGLGTISHTLLTIAALRSRDIRIAGVVINQYPAEDPGIAEETNPDAIARFGNVPVLCLIPQFTSPAVPHLPPDVVATIDTVDWIKLV